MHQGDLISKRRTLAREETGVPGFGPSRGVTEVALAPSFRRWRRSVRVTTPRQTVARTGNLEPRASDRRVGATHRKQRATTALRPPPACADG